MNRSSDRSFVWRLLQCFFCWGTPKPKGDLTDAQIIVVQAASDLVDDSSSQINKELAQYVADLHSLTRLPTHAQGEVARILDKRSVPLLGRTYTQKEALELNLPYIETIHVALQQKQLCDEIGWGRVAVVAPVPHIWRVVWVYERLGYEIIIPAQLPHFLWGEKLEQERWRTPWKAYRYELGARLLYLYKGYI